VDDQWLWDECRWFDVGAVVLSDITRGVALESFTQMTPVPTAIVTMAQEETSEEEQKSLMGFKIPVGSLMASNLHVSLPFFLPVCWSVIIRVMLNLILKSTESCDEIQSFWF
jgi:hypothetical protein